MKRTLWILLLVLVPVGAAAGGAGVLAYWLQPARPDAALRVPERIAYDWGDETGSADLKNVNQGTLIRGDGVASDDPGMWPQFRGANRTSVAPPEEKLYRSWPETGPEVLWTVDVGEGHAGVAIRNGCVFIIDYDRAKKEDVIRCLSLADGKEIWRYTYYVSVKRNHGMSRTVPALTDDYVVTLGPKGHVHCLKANSGELVWKMDLVKDYGSTIPPWYAGQCPLIEGDRVILAPGANPLMMAVELASGEIVWKTPNPDGWQMTHSSIVPMDYRGQRQYVYCASRGVVGVRASDGMLLWSTTKWRVKIANIPSPLVIDAERIFFSGGYNSGAAMFRLSGDGTDIRAEQLFRLKPTTFGSPQQTPVLYKRHIYGVIPGGEMVCLDLSGRQVWTSGSTNRFGLGPFMIADGMLLILQDTDCTLHLAEAGTDGYRELARARIFDGHDAWAPMALVDGKLVLRDRDWMKCLKVGDVRQ